MIYPVSLDAGKREREGEEDKERELLQNCLHNTVGHYIE